jgi:hemerythrin
MRQMRYEAYNWHKAQHDGVRRTIKRFVARAEEGDRRAGGDLLLYLADWMRDHTGVTDRMMTAHLRNFERRSAIISKATKSVLPQVGLPAVRKSAAS